MLSAELENLLRGSQILWRGNDHDSPVNGIPTGFTALDAALPGNGWPAAALTEILHESHGIGELRLLLPALARLGGDGRLQAWISSPFIPYAPALAAADIPLSSMWAIHPQEPNETLWATEQLLRSGLCSAVLSWPETSDTRALRRLQLAAEQGNCWGVVFRDSKHAVRHSPSALRLRLSATNDELEVRILKARGGWGGQKVYLSLKGS